MKIKILMYFFKERFYYLFKKIKLVYLILEKHLTKWKLTYTTSMTLHSLKRARQY